MSDAYPCPFFVPRAKGDAAATYLAARQADGLAVVVDLRRCTETQVAVVFPRMCLVKADSLRTDHHAPGMSSEIAKEIVRQAHPKSPDLNSVQVSATYDGSRIRISTGSHGSYRVIRDGDPVEEVARLNVYRKRHEPTYMAVIKAPGLRMTDLNYALAQTLAGIWSGEAEVARRDPNTHVPNRHLPRMGRGECLGEPLDVEIEEESEG